MTLDPETLERVRKRAAEEQVKYVAQLEAEFAAGTLGVVPHLSLTHPEQIRQTRAYIDMMKRGL